MEGREGMSLPGYYFNNRSGIFGPSNVSSPTLHAAGGSSSSTTTPPIFRPLSNPNTIPSTHESNASRISGGSFITNGPSFQFEDPSPNYPHAMNSATVASHSGGGGASLSGEASKKKRGRPRKYGPEGTNVALGLSPLPPPPRKMVAESTSSGEKARRGRPPGTGWKQKLAPLGEWMNSSAGLAFSPHVLYADVGEDIAEKILAFAQQRPRDLCIMSANGSISSITLRQPTNSSATVTFEGRFEILSLSGSYLVSENDGPRNRSGGISISICSHDGHVIGGSIGGRLIAASPVQVIACSFVHGNVANEKPKTVESEAIEGTYAKVVDQSAQQNLSMTRLNLTASNPNYGTSTWLSDAQADIDLAR